MNNEKIGQFISRERKARQLTQKELAEKLNVTDKAVSKWERGLSYPDISLLIPISDILGVNVSELLNGERSEDTEVTAETAIAVENVLEYASNAVNNKNRSFVKRAAIIAVSAIMLFMGFTLFIWPPITGFWNARIMRGIISLYLEDVDQLSQAVIDEHFRQAEEHNSALREMHSSTFFSVGMLMTANHDDYWNILNFHGIIGVVDIPKLNITFPILHDVADMANPPSLRGVHHLAGTAFPTGGYGNHSVLYTFADLFSIRMFRHLDTLDIGDTFYITVLNQRLVYKVDSIFTILPHEIEYIRAIPDADVVTFMTCVPYRVNTHRLLIRGKRIPYVSGMAASNIY